MNRSDIDWLRITLFIVIIGVSATAGWFGQPWIHDNSEIRSITVNVFSVLAGFIIAVMTFIGDPGLNRGRTWRSDEIHKRVVYNRLIRHQWLFITYLFVLMLVMMVAVVIKSHPNSLLTTNLERLYTGTTCLAFCYSFLLPCKLIKYQLERFDELIEMRRRGRNNI